jgi:peptidoglycan/LPS O-acetylase OafA/YrhL
VPAPNEFVAEEKVYFTQLDGLRFIAIFFVLVYHWLKYQWISWLALGANGVNLFFVISGFLISHVLIKARLTNESLGSGHWRSVKAFYLRRSLRIFPIYYLVILVAFVVDLYPVREIIGWLISYSMYAYVSFQRTISGGGFNHFWSLGIEEHFYLFYPFLIFFLPREKLKYVFLAFTVIALVTRFYFHENVKAQYALLPSCLDAFAVGGFLSYLYVFKRPALKKILENSWLMFSSALVFFLVVCVYSRMIMNYDERGIILNRLLFSIFCFWLVGRSVMGCHSGVFKAFLENRLIIYLGQISYGIYVFHFFIDKVLKLAFNKLKWDFPIKDYTVSSALVYFLITFAIAVCSWHLVEKPVNKLKFYFKY